jgi:hypothetical protein
MSVSAVPDPPPKKKRSEALMGALATLTNPIPHDEIAGMTASPTPARPVEATPDAAPATKHPPPAVIAPREDAGAAASPVVTPAAPLVPDVAAATPTSAYDLEREALATKAATAVPITPDSRLRSSAITGDVGPTPISFASKTWEKVSFALGPEDLATLDEFHAGARQLGVKMRRGSNPSLFARASFRLLRELMENNPEDFRRRVAAISETLGQPKRSG